MDDPVAKGRVAKARAVKRGVVGSLAEIGPARVVRHGVVALSVFAVALSLSGCSHLHWPFHRKPAPPPPEVHELDETSEGGASASFPQYWMRNTLIVDLQGASGSGSVVLKPREGTQWPIRIAFKVTPGSIGELEVRAAQRIVLPVTTAGGKPVVLELTPRIFTMKTKEMAVSWEPNQTPSS